MTDDFFVQWIKQNESSELLEAADSLRALYACATAEGAAEERNRIVQALREKAYNCIGGPHSIEEDEYLLKLANEIKEGRA